jgi:hypothetical protein
VILTVDPRARPQCDHRVGIQQWEDLLEYRRLIGVHAVSLQDLIRAHTGGIHKRRVDEIAEPTQQILPALEVEPGQPLENPIVAARIELRRIRRVGRGTGLRCGDLHRGASQRCDSRGCQQRPAIQNAHAAISRKFPTRRASPTRGRDE